MILLFAHHRFAFHRQQLRQLIPPEEGSCWKSNHDIWLRVKVSLVEFHVYRSKARVITAARLVITAQDGGGNETPTEDHLN